MYMTLQYNKHRQQVKMKVFLVLCVVGCCTAGDYIATLKVLKDGENPTLNNKEKSNTKWAEETVAVPPDQGGNYGDLIYRGRENNDRLLVREVVLIEAIESTEQDFQWYTSISNARTISHVRTLNIGRERAYNLRIDVAGQDAQVIFRVPAYKDPRLLIEVYGY